MTEEDQMMRLDLALVARGLMESRAQAQAAIKAGGVTVDGAAASKASLIVRPDQAIEATPAHPYVSRGGLKLAHALERFAIDPHGLVCLDIGASTGGFTDVLLRAGAARVYAVDVGRDQLHARLRADPRVVDLQAVDARSLTREEIREAPDLLVCDASFIMLEKVLSAPLALLSETARAIVLFKPQFQVGPENIGRGGHVTDRRAVEAAWDRFSSWLKQEGWKAVERIDSPIRGGGGAREYLAQARR